MGDVVVVTGPPGSGKSAVGSALADLLDPSVLLEADWFFGRWRTGAVDPWRPEAAPQTAHAGRAALAATVEFARSGAWVVYDGVLDRAATTDLAALAREAGVAVHRVVLLPPVDACLARVAARTGHGFDDPGATQDMHAAFAADAESTGDAAVLRDDGAPADRLAERVRDLLRAGALRVQVRVPTGGARP
ncbi:AAA family ATPase [Isoptericola sp. NPDC019482]|uniref:AAA family ATPase n=1 Tax=Isoptericola sp. NPDC019482 TaxID=3154688 RepID=UPI00347DAF2C